MFLRQDQIQFTEYSFMTLAPEHELVSKITTDAQKVAVEKYITATAKRSERDRMADVKTISGVFTGAYAIHPFSERKSANLDWRLCVSKLRNRSSYGSSLWRST